jgi:hypothetical protein
MPFLEAPGFADARAAHFTQMAIMWSERLLTGDAFDGWTDAELLAWFYPHGTALRQWLDKNRSPSQTRG